MLMCINLQSHNMHFTPRSTRMQYPQGLRRPAEHRAHLPLHSISSGHQFLVVQGQCVPPRRPRRPATQRKAREYPGADRRWPPWQPGPLFVCQLQWDGAIRTLQASAHLLAWWVLVNYSVVLSGWVSAYEVRWYGVWLPVWECMLWVVTLCGIWLPVKRGWMNKCVCNAGDSASPKWLSSIEFWWVTISGLCERAWQGQKKYSRVSYCNQKSY